MPETELLSIAQLLAIALKLRFISPRLSPPNLSRIAAPHTSPPRFSDHTAAGTAVISERQIRRLVCLVSMSTERQCDGARVEKRLHVTTDAHFFAVGYAASSPPARLVSRMKLLVSTVVGISS